MRPQRKSLLEMTHEKSSPLETVSFHGKTESNHSKMKNPLIVAATFKISSSIIVGVGMGLIEPFASLKVHSTTKKTSGKASAFNGSSGTCCTCGMNVIFVNTQLAYFWQINSMLIKRKVTWPVGM